MFSLKSLHSLCARRCSLLSNYFDLLFIMLGHITCTECKCAAFCCGVGCVSVCLLDITLSCAKMAELIELLFGV